MRSCPERGSFFLRGSLPFLYCNLALPLTNIAVKVCFTGGISYEAFFDIGFRVNRYFFVFEVL